jgi:hypothetical protein
MCITKKTNTKEKHHNMNNNIQPHYFQVPETSELIKQFGRAVDIPAFGGRLEVNWTPGARVTSSGGLAYFAIFLKVTGLFDRLCEDFPIAYTSNNASSKRDIIGTAVLAILLGKRRYIHIEAIRHDEAARELLGLDEIVSDTTVRRAFKNCSEKALDEWLSRHEREVYEILLSFKYILDIDNTVKPIYGHQEGAELGYNPIKPGRPSHNYHSFFIGRARISLGVDVRPGKQHSGRWSMTRLWPFIDSLPEHLRPTLVRGDVGYGSDAIMCEAELRGIIYLFKMRRSSHIKRLFKAIADSAEWENCGFGWQAREITLGLDGWKKPRRVLFIRRPAEKKDEHVCLNRRERKRAQSPKAGIVVPVASARPKQEEFEFVKDCKGREWDYCALVTNDEKMNASMISQLYRDRGDCENNFDEFKNQWGWAGFTTQKLKPCKVMARLIAIVANWWNVFCRLADPTAHREAITSRPAYMSIMGRIVESGRKRTIHLTSTHAESKQIQRALDTVAAFFRWLTSTAEQLDDKARWMLIVRCAFRKILLPDPALKPLLALK